MRRITLITLVLALALLSPARAGAQEGEPGFWASSVGATDVELDGEPPAVTDAAGDAAAVDDGGPAEPDVASVTWYGDRTGGEVAKALEALVEEPREPSPFTLYGGQTLGGGAFTFVEIRGRDLTGVEDFQIDLTGLRPDGVGGPSALAVHPFKGKDVAYSLFSAGGQPPTSAGYEHTASGYRDLDHAPLWLVTEGLVVVVIPHEWLAEASSWTLWVSSGQWGFGNTYDSVELPGIEAPPDAALVPAAAPPATVATEAPAEQPESAATSVAAVPIDDEGGGSFSFLIVVPMAVFGVGIGYVVYRVFSRTRERGKPGGPAHAGGEDDDDMPPRDTPAPIVYGEELDDGERCDWAVYWQNPGGVLVPLREAKGHECCVYTLAVTGRLLDHAEAAIVRQAPELVGVGGEPARARLQAEEHGVWGAGLSPSAWATARSGPAGDQSWMQGGGDRVARPAVGAMPATTDPELPATGPLDAGSRIRYLDQTRIGIRLDSGCDHDNHFHAHGTTTATVASTYECANDEPGGRCPVEVVSAGTFRSQVSGDLTYEVTARALHDTQDPAPSTDAPMITVGSHDHAARPRASHEETVDGHADTEKEGDAIEIVVTDLLDLNAGVLVPPASWGTTGRVSAGLGVELDQTVQLDAEMDNHDDGACCGRAGCDCAPRLRLVVAGGTASIDVDGATFTALAPVWPSSGAEQEWRL